VLKDRGWHMRASKGKLIIAIWVLTLVVSMISGSCQTVPSETQRSSEQSPGTPTYESIDTSDWKTYQSLTMGFSIKYPSDWEIIPEHPYFGGKRVAFKSVNVELVVIQGASIYSEGKRRYLAFEEIVDAERRIALNSIDSQEAEVLLDGDSAIAVSYTQYWERATQYVKIARIYEKSRNFWIYLSIYNYDEVQEEEIAPIFNGMISSFRSMK